MTIICHCADVKEADIEARIQEGASDLTELMDDTGAGLGCGKCVEVLEDMLNRRTHEVIWNVESTPGHRTVAITTYNDSFDDVLNEVYVTYNTEDF